MERRPTRTRTTLAGFLLALTLIAPWALGQDPDPIADIRRFAERGDAEAQFNLGVMYAKGEGVPRDDTEAARWFRLAAEQGDATSQFNLGIMYSDGRGVLKDSVLAHMWYNIAAANGNEMAREARDNLEGDSGFFRSEPDLTRDEICRATELARTCMASDYQSCGS